jgi:tetratricopeptide (TPR) repeat protein
MKDLTSRLRMGAFVVAIVAMMTAPAWAQHPATLMMKNGGRAQGTVRYLASSRSFEIKTGNGITQTVRASEVDRVIVARPPDGLQEAVNAVNRGSYQSAIPTLKKIADSYVMLGPDVIASMALAKAYLGTNRTKEAMKVCEELQRVNPNALNDGSFASVYWEALLAEGRISTLRTSLQSAIETGSREVAAVAQVRRGDLEMKEGRPREALVDGYLRTVLLFQDIEFIQPEALYKAIEAHTALNETRYAEKWRKQLLGKYGASEFAAKAKN